MTSLDANVAVTPFGVKLEFENDQPEVEDSRSNHSTNSSKSNSSDEQYYCQSCKRDYYDHGEFLDHLKTHVQLPKVVLQRVDDPEIKKQAKLHKCGPLKFTVRTTNNNFKIINTSENKQGIIDECNYPRIPKLRILLPEQLSEQLDEQRKSPEKISTNQPLRELATKNPVEEPGKIICNGGLNKPEKMVELHSLPSESQSPSFPTQSPSQPDTANNDEHNSFWNSQPTEDPLLLPQSGEKEAETHNSLLQNFLNDTVNLKDSSSLSNETEYISLERLAEKKSPTCPLCGERCVDQKSLDIHQKAMGHYMIQAASSNSLLSNNSLVPYGQPSLSSNSMERSSLSSNSLERNSLSSNPLDSLSTLPMQQLAQQVNRLQQSGVHQQNVLINIQQFGQPMGQTLPPPQYGRPPEMPHYQVPGQHYPGQQQSPHMYGGYHPSPMNHPMYYPPTSGMYPPMPQHPSSHQPSVPHTYTPSAPPHQQSRMMPPRAPHPQPPQQRMAPPPPPMGQHRPRARMPMQRGPTPRMMGPRGPTATNISQGMPRPNMPQQPRPQRRAAPAPPPTDPAKRKRMDVFLPDTNDNDECSVISVQKANDGLPVIKSVQGASSSAPEVDPIVHLTDSITLSVRNPKEQPQPVVQQKKNDAKAVANILATRGITVTPAAKAANNNSPSNSELKRSPQKSASPPVAINLNSAVSIIPTARGNNSTNQQKESTNNRASRPPTVDLTDDDPVQIKQSQNSSSTAATVSKRTLPHHCDLCPAQYPTLQSLMQHRKSYHKIVSQNELGVPVVDLKQTNVLNKLAAIGIHSYIPLPQLGNGNGSFALPIVSVNAAKNPNICNLGALGSGAVLPLGPLRHMSSSPNKQ